MLSALHSVVVDVRDFEVAVRDYARLLGATPLRLEFNAARGTRSAHFALVNTVLELRAATGTDGGTAIGGGEASGDPKFGQAGFRLVCEDDAPAVALAARGVLVASSEDEEAVFVDEQGRRRWRTHRIDPKSSRGLPVELISGETIESSGKRTEGASSVAPAARIRGLDHVVVMSPDPEGTLAFYREGLGLRLALDKSFPERAVRLLFFRVGGTTIEIGARLGVGPRPDHFDRFGGLAWQVVEIDAIRARLAGDGFDVSEIRDGNKPGTRVCTVRDPVHDVPTLLIEPVSVGAPGRRR